MSLEWVGRSPRTYFEVPTRTWAFGIFGNIEHYRPSQRWSLKVGAGRKVRAGQGTVVVNGHPG